MEGYSKEIIDTKNALECANIFVSESFRTLNDEIRNRAIQAICNTQTKIHQLNSVIVNGRNITWKVEEPIAENTMDKSSYLLKMKIFIGINGDI